MQQAAWRWWTRSLPAFCELPGLEPTLNRARASAFWPTPGAHFPGRNVSPVSNQGSVAFILKRYTKKILLSVCKSIPKPS